MNTDLYSKNTTTCKRMKNSRFIMVEIRWGGVHRKLQCSWLFYFFKESEINMKICSVLTKLREGSCRGKFQIHNNC